MKREAVDIVRKGNVDVVCQRYGVRRVDDLAALVSVVRAAAK